VLLKKAIPVIVKASLYIYLTFYQNYSCLTKYPAGFTLSSLTGYPAFVLAGYPAKTLFSVPVAIPTKNFFSSNFVLLRYQAPQFRKVFLVLNSYWYSSALP
jgi:hypothetical protein